MLRARHASEWEGVGRGAMPLGKFGATLNQLRAQSTGQGSILVLYYGSFYYSTLVTGSYNRIVGATINLQARGDGHGEVALAGFRVGGGARWGLADQSVESARG